jgi:hypothetical protein
MCSPIALPPSVATSSSRRSSVSSQNGNLAGAVVDFVELVRDERNAPRTGHGSRDRDGAVIVAARVLLDFRDARRTGGAADHGGGEDEQQEKSALHGGCCFKNRAGRFGQPGRRQLQACSPQWSEWWQEEVARGSPTP